MLALRWTMPHEISFLIVVRAVGQNSGACPCLGNQTGHFLAVVTSARRQAHRCDLVAFAIDRQVDFAPSPAFALAVSPDLPLNQPLWLDVSCNNASHWRRRSETFPGARQRGQVCIRITFSACRLKAIHPSVCRCAASVRGSGGDAFRHDLRARRRPAGDKGHDTRCNARELRPGLEELRTCP